MLRKPSLLLLLGMASTSAFAHATDFTGFYANLNVGGINTAATMHSIVDANYIFFTPDNMDSFQDSRVWRNTLYGSFTLGYGGFIRNQFHVGLEAFYSLANRFVHMTDNVTLQQIVGQDFVNIYTKTTAKLHTGEWGLDILPGYEFDKNTLVYARVGIGFNRLNLSTDTLLSIFNGAATAYSSLYNADDKTKHALRLGFGFEHAVSANCAFTADYIYSDYGYVETDGRANTTGLAQAGNTITPFGLYNSSTARLHTHTLSIGMKYYFC